MDIQKYTPNELESLITKSLEEQNSVHIKVGAIFINGDYFLKITKILVDENTLNIFYGYSNDLGKNWYESYGSDYLNRFNSRYPKSCFLVIPIEEYLKDVDDLITGKVSLDYYKDKSDVSNESSLINVRSKEYLSTLKTSLEEKRSKVELLKTGVKLQMEAKRRELDAIRSSLGLIVAEFQEKVEQIQKVLYTIELYLGIKEDIVQIQEGTSANENEPIHFWQERLFMDEEVGDPEDGGLDFKNIKDFDSWLLKYSSFYKKYNYELLIPQQKGLIVLRVRRDDKRYSDNPFVNGMLNQENHKTYILIRNGTNVYRIWADIIIHKLFPDKERLAEMQEIWEYLEKREDVSSSTQIGDEEDNMPEAFKKNYRGYHKNIDIKKEKKNLEEEAFNFKQYFLMLQGLIDRTEVFYPIPTRIQLIDTSAQDKGYVKFVYEDKGSKLSDGKLSFNVWLKSLNSDIQIGSRVLFVETRADYNLIERLDKRFSEGSYNTPKRPTTGIHIVKKYITKESRWKDVIIESEKSCPQEFRRNLDNKLRDLKWDIKHSSDPNKEIKWPITINHWYEEEVTYQAISYNPGGEIRNWWDRRDDGHERKNSLSFKIFKDDSFILKYDEISLEDVTFYLYDRRNRRSYLKMMPLLKELKTQREEELQKEVGFIKGLIDHMKRTDQKISDPKTKIYEAIDWWKLKNVVKRPLTDNDELAWKQIKKRLKLI